MSAHLRDGGPAFAEVPADCNGYEGRPGMSLRDYFAARALPTVIRQCVTDTRNPGESLEEYFARASYLIADAMLKARQA